MNDELTRPTPRRATTAGDSHDARGRARTTKLRPGVSRERGISPADAGSVLAHAESQPRSRGKALRAGLRAARRCRPPRQRIRSPAAAAQRAPRAAEAEAAAPPANETPERKKARWNACREASEEGARAGTARPGEAEATPNRGRRVARDLGHGDGCQVAERKRSRRAKAAPATSAPR